MLKKRKKNGPEGPTGVYLHVDTIGGGIQSGGKKTHHT